MRHMLNKSQSGFGMVETLIAMAIGLFLIAGLDTVFISVRQSFLDQKSLADLQNNEIQATNILGNVIQIAGYYPTPQVTTQNAAFPAALQALPFAINYASGQSVFGGSVGGVDAIAIRAVQHMDCTGNISAGAAPVVSTFTIQNNNLVCAVGQGAFQPLVSGVASMSILYGVDPLLTGSVTQYVSSANVLSWTSVLSVKLIINFVNPLYNAGVQNGQPVTISATRVFNIMSNI